MAQIYPRALGLLFVASYYSQGYGGGILTCLQVKVEVKLKLKLKMSFYRRPVGQLVLVSSSHLESMTRFVVCLTIADERIGL
jgi:hypothetical protein